MPDTANAVARPLDFDSPGPGPVNALLLEAIRALGGRLREMAVVGRTGARPEAQAAAGPRADGRGPRTGADPEALVLAAAAEEMRRVFDRAFQDRPTPLRESVGSDGPGRSSNDAA